MKLLITGGCGFLGSNLSVANQMLTLLAGYLNNV